MLSQQYQSRGSPGSVPFNIYSFILKKRFPRQTTGLVLTTNILTKKYTKKLTQRQTDKLALVNTTHTHKTLKHNNNCSYECAYNLVRLRYACNSSDKLSSFVQKIITALMLTNKGKGQSCLVTNLHF